MPRRNRGERKARGHGGGRKKKWWGSMNRWALRQQQHILGYIKIQEAAITDESQQFQWKMRRYGWVWVTSSGSDNVGHRITMSRDFQTDYILFYF